MSKIRPELLELDSLVVNEIAQRTTSTSRYSEQEHLWLQIMTIDTDSF